MSEITIKPKGKAVETEEAGNGEVILNYKFLYSCKPADLFAIRSWAYTQEQMFRVDNEANKRIDLLIKTIDKILNKTIWGL